MALIIILVIVVLLALIVIGKYNSFIQLKNQGEEAYAQIDTHLKQRYDLIPNLVETVKGYAKHEQSTLTAVIEARNKAMSAQGVEAKDQADKAFEGTLKSLFALSEAYPELKANTNFTQLQNQLSKLESEILQARKYYNGVVKTFNNAIMTFPSNIIAGMFGFKTLAMFEVAESLRRTKVVKHKEAHNNKKRVVLAFAHNAGDRAETVLFRLFRGTGLKGLRGIEAVSQRNGFKIIRPLLSCSRPEIEAYMISSGGNWVEDKTNAEDEYSRNKIRHHILGFATDNINKKSVENICRAAEDATDAYDYISRQAQKAYESIVELREAHKTINISKFKQLDPFLQKQVLLLFFEEHTQARKDLTKDHFEVVLGLLWTSGNKKYNLPYGLTAVKEYDSFYLDTKRDSKELSDSNYHTGKLDYTIQQIVLDYTKDMEIPISTYTKWLDYDKIHSRVEIRNRRAGDYICINDAGNRMSLKKYFINEKIPASMRPRIVVVADGSHVLWVVGYRISADVKISGDTKRVLALSAIQNQN